MNRSIAIALLAFGEFVLLSLIILAYSIQQTQRRDTNPDANRASQNQQPPGQVVTPQPVREPLNEPKPPSQPDQSYLQQVWQKAKTDPIVWLTAVLACIAAFQVAVYRQMH